MSGFLFFIRRHRIKKIAECHVKASVALFNGKFAVVIFIRIPSVNLHSGSLLRAISEMNPILAQHLHDFEKRPAQTKSFTYKSPTSRIHVDRKRNCT